MKLFEPTTEGRAFVNVHGKHLQALSNLDEQGRFQCVWVKWGAIPETEPRKPSDTSTSLPPEPPVLHNIPLDVEIPRWRVSKAFRDRLWKFTKWSRGWDGEEEGAERIAYPTAGTALAITGRMMDIAGEPFIAPATDGSLVLVWKFEDRSSVEVYVEPDEERPTWASVTEGGAVDEVTLKDDDSLTALLKDRASRPA